MIVHAGCVALRLGGRWRGVLLTGASGSGKSDLALRLLDRGWRLVADDRCVLWRSGDALFARTPDTLAGLMEVRGVGLVAEPTLRFAEVVLASACDEPPDRLPDPTTVALAGADLPALALRALEASAPEKLARALFAAVQRDPLDPARDRRI